MLIVIFLISIILIGLGFYFAYKNRWNGGSWEYENGGTISCFIFGFIGALSSIICIIFTIDNLINLKVVNNKINILEENNAYIEEKIYAILETYCEHENKTLVDISPDNPEMILLLYPELKAVTLFESYIETIKSNNQQIKDLKLEKANNSIYQWWLYFGG